LAVDAFRDTDCLNNLRPHALHGVERVLRALGHQRDLAHQDLASKTRRRDRKQIMFPETQHIRLDPGGWRQ
jgi:hypothetical protein